MLHCQRCLLIPDVHQDTVWVDRVLEQEKDCDFVVFLGDYFDTYLKHTRAGKSATCEWLLRVQQAWLGRSLFLLGNHDIQYLEAKPAADLHRKARYMFYRCGSAFTGAGALRIAKGLPKEFWAGTRLFVVVNGFLVSHAGLAELFWPKTDSIEHSLTELQSECTLALSTMRRSSHRLLEIGKVRGGNAEIGGITWLDWDDEFTDGLPLPQIVGHTGSDAGARQKGRSWCIDGHQTCYGLLTPEGLSVRNT